MTDLAPGTTYTCVLASENAAGGYSQPVVPAGSYRLTEDVFKSTFYDSDTSPDYPEAVTDTRQVPRIHVPHYCPIDVHTLNSSPSLECFLLSQVHGYS